MIIDGFSDEELRQAAKQVVKSMMNSLPRPEECHHEFSPAFLAKMDKIIKGQRRKEMHARVVQRIASVALAILVGASTWLAVDTEARAAFVSWIREVYEDSFIYRYFAPDTGRGLPDYEIKDLPEGYIQTFFENNGDSCIQLYQHDDQTISFFYYKMQAGWEHIIVEKESDSNCTLKEVVVNGTMADMYLYDDATSASELILINEKKGIVFHITAFLDEDQMIKIAENISLKKD